MAPTIAEFPTILGSIQSCLASRLCHPMFQTVFTGVGVPDAKSGGFNPNIKGLFVSMTCKPSHSVLKVARKQYLTSLSHGTFFLSLSLFNPSSSSRIKLISFPVSCLSCPGRPPLAAHRYFHTMFPPHFTGLTGSDWICIVCMNLNNWKCGALKRDRGGDESCN